MRVKFLLATVYGNDGWTWWTEGTRNPTWDAIEGALRRLDRSRYPFIWLYLSAEPEPYASPDFAVIGGAGEFAMEVFTPDAYYRYCDESRGDDEIEVWHTDQGATFEAKYCCPSLDTARRIIQYFCEYGAPEPGAIWQPQPSQP